MNHKHIEVIIEAHDYADEYDTWDVINDFIDYVEFVEASEVDKHYEKCIANDTPRG